MVFDEVCRSNTGYVLYYFIRIIRARLSRSVLPINVRNVRAKRALLNSFLNDRARNSVLRGLNFNLNRVRFFFCFLQQDGRRLRRSLTSGPLTIRTRTCHLLSFHRQALLRRRARRATTNSRRPRRVNARIFTRRRPSNVKGTLIRGRRFNKVVSVRGHMVSCRRHVFIFPRNGRRLDLIFRVLNFRSFRSLCRMCRSNAHSVLLVYR